MAAVATIPDVDRSILVEYEPDAGTPVAWLHENRNKPLLQDAEHKKDSFEGSRSGFPVPSSVGEAAGASSSFFSFS